MADLKHYVTFYSPGTLMSEQITMEIDSWDTRKAVGMAEQVIERHGARPYAFVFKTFAGDKGCQSYSESAKHFLGGKLDTYDDVVARNDPGERILRSNMSNNGIWIVCVNTNSWKSTMPFEARDKIVDAKGETVEDGSDPKWAKYRADCAAKYNQN